MKLFKTPALLNRRSPSKFLAALAIIMMLTTTNPSPTYAGMPVTVDFNPADLPHWIAELANWGTQLAHNVIRQMQISFQAAGGPGASKMLGGLNTLLHSAHIADNHNLAEATKMAEIAVAHTMPPNKSFCYPIAATQQWHDVYDKVAQLETALEGAIVTLATKLNSQEGQAALAQLNANGGFSGAQSNGSTAATDPFAPSKASIVVHERNYKWPSNVSVVAVPVPSPSSGSGSSSSTQTIYKLNITKSSSSDDQPGDAAILYCVNMLRAVPLQTATNPAAQQGTSTQLGKTSALIHSCVTAVAERLQISQNATGGLAQVGQSYYGMCTLLNGGSGTGQKKYQAISPAQFTDCQTNGVSYLQLRQYYKCRHSGNFQNLQAQAQAGMDINGLDAELRDTECGREQDDFERESAAFTSNLATNLATSPE